MHKSIRKPYIFVENIIKQTTRFYDMYGRFGDKVLSDLPKFFGHPFDGKIPPTVPRGCLGIEVTNPKIEVGTAQDLLCSVAYKIRATPAVRDDCKGIEIDLVLHYTASSGVYLVSSIPGNGYLGQSLKEGNAYNQRILAEIVSCLATYFNTGSFAYLGSNKDVKFYGKEVVQATSATGSPYEGITPAVYKKVVASNKNKACVKHDKKYRELLQAQGTAEAVYRRLIDSMSRLAFDKPTSVKEADTIFMGLLNMDPAEYKGSLGKSYNRFATLLAEFRSARTEYFSAVEAVEAHEQAYTGWQRWFVVPGGHVHSRYNCQTLNNGMRDTNLVFVPEFSGIEVDNMQEGIGTGLCSFCFNHLGRKRNR